MIANRVLCVHSSVIFCFEPCAFCSLGKLTSATAKQHAYFDRAVLSVDLNLSLLLRAMTAIEECMLSRAHFTKDTIARAKEAQMTIGFFLGLFGSITSELEELPDGRQKGAAQAKEDVSATAQSLKEFCHCSQISLCGGLLCEWHIV